MIRLKALEDKYPINYHEAFEDLATLMFCADLDLPSGVNRRINQEGIESDPVRIGDKVYAYQAKYYKASTRLKERKSDFIKSIAVAQREKVTNLYFFIDKKEPDKDSKTHEEVSYIKEIEDAAKKKSIQLEWWTESKIESALTKEGGKFDFIRKIYFNDDTQSRFLNFYEYAYKRLRKKPRNNNYDLRSLQDSYIEPYLMGTGQSVRGFIEEFVEDEECITVISGEPGQGKTSLCYKAMTDFNKNGWLVGKVSNVLCFSLNPAGLSESVYMDGDFVLSPLLSWGSDRRNQTFSYEDCKDALVFFDGFDELLEKYPELIYSRFFNSIKEFQEETESHVVITSRNIAVVDSDECDEVLRELNIHTYSLQRISKSEQENWISSLKEYMNENDPQKADAVGKYLDLYQQMDIEDDIKSILGIPRIFRMVVNSLMLPQKGNSVTEFYDKLFDINWARRKRSDLFQKDQIKGKLQEYALCIFLSNNKTVELDIRSNASWVFSYYMKNYGDKKVGFLYDAFYSFFLAKEIFSWYENYSYGNDSADKKETFHKNLLNLARNKLDMKTIKFIKELFERRSDSQRKKVSENAFREAYDILKASPLAIMPVLHNSEIKEQFDETHLIGKANHSFYNIVSIGSACGQRVSVDNTDIRAMRYYNLSGCILNNANLRGSDVDLRGALMKAADLKEANFAEACLRGADFSQADLSGAIFAGADLRGAIFSSVYAEADVNNGYLDVEETKLCRVNFQKAKLQGTDFSGANLSGTDFRGAELKGADFTGAFFERTIFTRDTESIDCLKDEVLDSIVWS